MQDFEINWIVSGVIYKCEYSTKWCSRDHGRLIQILASYFYGKVHTVDGLTFGKNSKTDTLLVKTMCRNQVDYENEMGLCTVH